MERRDLFAIAIAMAMVGTVTPSLAQPISAGSRIQRRIPFEIVNGMVLVAGRIGATQGTFLVDTGSSATLVDSGFAGNLNLVMEEGEETLPFLFYPRAQGKRVVLESFSIGAFQGYKQPAFVTDLSRISLDVGRTIDALIGINSLCSLETLEIDYSLREITVFPGRDHFDNPQNYCRGAPPVIEVTVNGRRSRLMLDTGSKFGIVLFDEAAPAVSLKVTLDEFDPRDHYAHRIRRPHGVPELDGLIGSGAMKFLSLRFAERKTQIELINPAPGHHGRR